MWSVTSAGFLVGVFLLAFLYASVGQGGASGFLALMSFLDLPAGATRTTALALSLLVGGLAFLLYWRAGFLAWRWLGWLLVGSVPGSVLGALTPINTLYYRGLLGVVLLASGFQLILPKAEMAWVRRWIGAPYRWKLTLVGALAGYIGGLVGVGGGILLGPFFLFAGWRTARQTAALTAPFIVANAGMALITMLLQGYVPVVGWQWWLLVAGLGGFAGAYLGSRWFSDRVVRVVLSVILLGAGLRLVLLV